MAIVYNSVSSFALSTLSELYFNTERDGFHCSYSC